MRSVGQIAAAMARAPWGHLAYTSIFERVVEQSTTGVALYGSLTSIAGASGTITVHAPTVAQMGGAPKMCFDFGVLNADGAHTVTIDTTDGKTINGGASITVPATAGAFAWVFYDLTAGQWVALLASGDQPSNLPSYKALGPTTDQTFTNGGAAAVNQAQITTAPFPVGQFAILTATFEVHNATAGATATAVCGIFDGTAGVIVDADLSSSPTTLQQTLDPNGEIQVFEVVTITTRVAGTGLARTFGISIAAADANNVVVRAGMARIVAQIVAG